jgi:hypothetical protein
MFGMWSNNVIERNVCLRMNLMHMCFLFLLEKKGRVPKR